jgi:hypothetical protein
MKDVLNNLAYTNTKEFYNDMNSQFVDQGALEINDDLMNDLDDEIANIEDAIYTK